MSFLLPQEITGTVQAARPVEIHGDRYVDVLVALEGEPGPRVLRVGATECPEGLAAGERVAVRFVMGVATVVKRA